MAPRTRKLEIVISGDASGGQKAIRGTLDDAETFSSKMSKIGNSVTGAVAGGFAVDKIVDFGGQLLGLSGQLTAIDTKVKTVFEGQSADIRAWADKNNEAFGLTDDKLAGLAANFGDLLKPMGFTADQAAGMSKDVVGLAGALSAWSGGTISAEGAAEKLSAAMLGEREGLKELGIAISQADVDARLAAKGQSELTGAALEQAEAVATQELIFEKSTDAQKAWAAGGNKALAAQNKLKATVGELQEWLATRLVPAMMKVVDIGMKVASWMGRNKDILLAVGIGVMAVLVPAIWAWASAAKVAAMNTLLMVAPAILIGAAIAGLALLIIKNWDTIREATKAAFDAVVGAVSGAFNWVKDNWPLLLAIITGPIGLAVLAVVRHWDTIREGISAVKDWISARVAEIVGFITGIPGRIGGIGSTMWAGIRDGATAAKDWVVGRLEDIVGFFTGMPGRIARAALGMWDGIRQAFRSAINWIIRGWNSIEFKIPGFDPPGPGPKFGGFTLGLPHIDPLAFGAVVDEPMLALIGENPRTTPEIVSPEDLMRRIVREETGGGVVENHFHFHGPVIAEERYVAGLMAKAVKLGYFRP